MQLFLSTLTGLVVGLTFALLKLPVPAPNNLAGVMGIVGLFVGYLLGQRLWPR